ncbi:hypothetical protein [Streptomyces sp. NPDC101166]|uniref:hypothetical protein n=1 Tax=Streptomyces sp. NPDC101166 TaxID=3366120 RepID=UPI0038211579
MRTDDILDQIDNTLHDWTVSDDAMRSQPAPEPEEYAAPRLWVAPAGTEPDAPGWEEVRGVLDLSIEQVTIDPTAIAPEITFGWEELCQYIAQVQAGRARRAQHILDVLKQALSQLAQPATEAAEAFRHLPEAVGCNDCAEPDPPRDRPAWQSPYGPPRRR